MTTGELNGLGRFVRAAGFGRVYYQLFTRPKNALKAYRLSREPLRVPLFGYTFFAPSPKSNPLSACVAQSGLWEPNVTQALRRELKPGQCLVDVGADIGYYVLLASQLNNGAPVLAFEPNSMNREYLERNISENQLSAVRLITAGLGNLAGELFLRTETARIDTSADEGTVGERVPIYRFDDLTPELLGGQIPKVDFVLIDVEGAELEVLKGMEITLRRDRPKLIVEVHGPFLPEFGTTKSEVLDWIRGIGYNIHWLLGDPITQGGYTNVLALPTDAP